MILRSLALCSVLAAAARADAPPVGPVSTPAPAAVPDSLRLSNGDALHGRFGGYSMQGGLAWEHPDGLAPLQFAPGSLDCVEWRRAAQGKDGAADVCVGFINGDSLAGKLVEYTPERTVVETPSGRFSFRSDAVEGLAPVKGGAGLRIEGIGRPEDWKMLRTDGERGTMEIADGKMTLSSGATVVREVAFGPRFRLEFEIQKPTGFFSFGFLLDTDDEALLKAQKFSCYAVLCHGGGAQLTRFAMAGNGQGKNRDGHSKDLGNVAFGFKPGANRLAVDVDAQEHTFTFFLNGKRVGVIKDPAPVLAGKYLFLGGDATLTHLSIAGGQFTAGSDLGANGPSCAVDRLTLANQDETTGRLLAIRDGKASFKTEFATLDIPLERISGLGLAHPPQPVKPAGQGDKQPDALVFFQDSTRLTLRLDAIKEGKLTGHSEILGNFQCGDTAVQKIVFNLHAPFRKPEPEPKPALAPVLEER